MEDLIFFSTRLKTKREKKRIIITAKEKQVRKQFKCRKELYKIKNNLPLVPLVQPYQKGFERYFVLREDCKNEKEIIFFTNLLKKINTVQYAENKKFQKKIKRFGKRIFVPRIQNLKQLLPYEFAGSHSNLNDEERQYFACVETYNPKTKKFTGLYEFLQPWRYRLIIKPNIITHHKPIVSDLEKEIAEVEHFFDVHKNQGILYKKIMGGAYSFDMKPKFKNPFTKRKFFNNKNSALEIAEMLMEKEHQLSKRH